MQIRPTTISLDICVSIWVNLVSLKKMENAAIDDILENVSSNLWLIFHFTNIALIGCLDIPDNRTSNLK